MLYACGLPGLVPYQYAARSTQTRDCPCKRCRLEGGKARSKPRGTKPCSAEDVPVADYAHVRVAAASIRLRTQANPPRGASTQSVGMAQDRASARMTSAGRRRWPPSLAAFLPLRRPGRTTGLGATRWRLQSRDRSVRVSQTLCRATVLGAIITGSAPGFGEAAADR
jgi:hypothetical protein